MKLILPALMLILTLAGCAGAPEKYSSRKIAPCSPGATSLQGVPYALSSKESCAVAAAPFDLGVWHEAPLNSHKIRGLETADLGCAPLTPEADDCGYSGIQGHSRTLAMNFDPSVYPEGARVRRAVLAVYAFSNSKGLYDEGQLRGRLNVGDELQSLARKREIWGGRSGDKGWLLFDVTAFAARAVSERRTSVHFEVSLPCQTLDSRPVTVGVLRNEPRLVVEFE